MTEYVLDAEKTYATYRAIQDLCDQWKGSSNNLKILGKNVHTKRCHAAADAYEHCANQLQSLISIIETLQGVQVGEYQK